LGLGPVLAHGDLPEGRLELQRGVDEDAVGEGDARAAAGGPVGEHELHHLLGERVEASAAPGPSPPKVATSWSRVAPPAPAARRPSATWRESGEKAALLVAGEGEESAAARRSVKRVWCPMEMRMSAVAIVGVAAFQDLRVGGWGR